MAPFISPTPIRREVAGYPTTSRAGSPRRSSDRVWCPGIPGAAQNSRGAAAMMWNRASEIIYYGHVTDVAKEKSTVNWLLVGVGFFLLAVLVAIGVLVWVSNADFDTGPAKVVPTSGPCEPFCTGTPPPPQ
ncbi:hypothetical protein [Nocardia farcinica]|nr:hypothetical protein [Nocardia farcinica]